ncbi:NAD dependent epimerase/dehydratase family protein [Neisseria sp. oral taxon 020 str. F0370]|uniref:NAD(P)H-binding protein n=1 Tax=unclassified Neisseria TaxID=2623750 RepID=UPI0002A30F33|nr:MULTISPECIES: NAD(P)H-binding protein [unclassified Neisseria]ASP18267.1 semialdehyde dehydrogenase [Neisseria sp. KEM232]EKY07991.1 NAD dependent epimerase/dehydratase family protein [Neisseria sp. oral taxon 020 str. F0370]
MTLTAAIIGATGATGRELTALLLDDPRFGEVHIFVRREPRISHDKLRVHIIDFARSADWAAQVRGDILFSCLGTTLKDAGSQEAQRQIDYQAVIDTARAARANGVPTFALLSAAGADPQSRIFYSRLKGELERDSATLAFPQLLVFRSPLLLRPDSKRPAEVWSARLLSALNAIGILKSQQSLPVADLARAMADAAAQAHTQAERSETVFPPADIRRLLGQG